ncbi:MAG: serine/threonine-protein phosphatase [Myxococcales bacterium]|nr:serine/threonine-protein phosphatase [Myxococcales bacterium]
MVALTFHSVTDVGRGREQNEDSCGEVATAGGELLVVCDGMGGHENGEVASRIAVDAILQIFQNSPSSDPAERLKNGFLVANQRILAHAEKAGLDGMGTTAVAAFVKDGEAWIAHVGDSRCYHLRGEAVLWRTLDHTRVQKMIDRGILTPEQAKTHEDANVVTRALGFARGEEQPEPDISAARELRDGDLLLLCSDGLFDLVKDEEIAELGSEDEPAEAAQRLVDLANRRGGHDNITVSLLRYGAAAKRSGGPRKTDLDEPGPGPSAMKTTDVAKSAAAAREIVARERAKEAAAAKDRPADPQSKKALGLVIAGIALVGIAAAVFLLTRGGEEEPTKSPARDAGAAAPNTGSGDPTDLDAGAGSAATGTVDGGALTAPTWDTPDRPKTGGGAGSGKKGSGAGSGSAGAGAGSGSAVAPAGAGSGATGGSGAGSGTTAGSATTPASTGSGGGGGFASKLGVGGGAGSGAGSAAPPKAPPGPPAVPTTPPTPPPTPPPTTTTPPTTPPKQPATTPPRAPALQPRPVNPPRPPATTPGVSPPGMTPSAGSGAR